MTFCSNTGAVVAQLPTAGNRLGRQYLVKKTGAGGSVTIQTTGSETIDGATTLVLSAQYQYARIASDGTNWQVVT
jgi:hypothetical protein